MCKDAGEPFHGLDEQDILDGKINRTEFKVTKIMALIYEKDRKSD